MAKLKIVKYGEDDILRKVSREVDTITPRIITLLDDMIETMHEADGCGLAAPQVGILRRIAVVEDEKLGIIEMINPTIIAFAGEQYEQEGCLSCCLNLSALWADSAANAAHNRFPRGEAVKKCP